MFFPKGITFDGYTKVFEFPQLLMGFKNSIIYTVVGTVINILVCVPTAFALSRKELVGRRFLNTFFLITMYFSGGLIPGYLLMKELHLLNKIWAIVLPGALSVYNMIICRSFFQSNASDELLESVKIDGGSYFTFFFKVVLPVSKAIIAVRKAVLFGSCVKGLADNQSDIDLFLDSGLKGLKFVGLVEDVRDVLDKDVDVFDKTHIIPNSKISLEILKDGVVIYEE